MSEKCKITFVFETGKEPIGEIYNVYSDGTSIKGSGKEIVNLCKEIIKDLTNNPLTEDNKLSHISIN